MLKIIFACVFFLLGIYQLYSSYNMFKFIQNKGNKATSQFILLSLWGSIVVGVALLGVPIYILI